MDKGVSDYMERQRSPQREICKKLRKLLLKAVPGIDERIKMGVAWYGKYYIVALEDSVNLGFSVEGLSIKEMADFKGRGKFMRHLKFKEIEEIDEKKIIKLLKLVDKNAKCGSCSK